MYITARDKAAVNRGKWLRVLLFAMAIIALLNYLLHDKITKFKRDNSEKTPFTIRVGEKQPDEPLLERRRATRKVSPVKDHQELPPIGINSGKRIWVALPSSDFGDEELVDQVVHVVSEVAAPLDSPRKQQTCDATKSWALMSNEKFDGADDGDNGILSRLAQRHCPAAVSAATDAVSAIYSIRSSTSNMECDELLVLFNPSEQYLQWMNALLGHVRSTMPQCSTTLLLDQDYLSQQTSLGNELVRSALDFSSTRVKVLHSANSFDALAVSQEKTFDAVAAALPSMRQHMYLFTGYQETDQHEKQLLQAVDSQSSDTVETGSYPRVVSSMRHVLMKMRYSSLSILTANMLYWLGQSLEDIEKASKFSSASGLPIPASAVYSPLKEWDTASKKTPLGNGVYVCGLVHDMAAIWPHYYRELLRFVDMLLAQKRRVFLKLVSSNNHDVTDELLQGEFLDELQSRSSREESLLEFELDMVGKDDRVNYKRDRGAYLAKMRNRALNKLTHAYGHVVFTNDVLTTAENMMDLLFKTAGGEDQYDLACGVDYDFNKWMFFEDEQGNFLTKLAPEKVLILYDVWVSRSLEGKPLFSRFPFFDNMPSRPYADGISHGQSVQVYTCWNGIVAFNPRVFLDAGIRFRSTDSFEQLQSDNRTASGGEAYYIGADMWDKGFNRIYVNPCSQSAYKWPVWREVTRSPLFQLCERQRAKSRRPTTTVPTLPTHVRPQQIVQCESAPVKEADGSIVLVNEPNWSHCRMIENRHRRTIMLRTDTHSQSHGTDVFHALADMRLKESMPQRPLDIFVHLEGNSKVNVSAFRSTRDTAFLDAVVFEPERFSPFVDLCVSVTIPPRFESCHPNAGMSVLWLDWPWGDAMPTDWVPQLQSLVSKGTKIWVPSMRLKKIIEDKKVPGDSIFVVALPSRYSSVPHSTTQKPAQDLAHLTQDKKQTHHFLFIGDGSRHDGLYILLKAFPQSFYGQQACLTVVSNMDTSLREQAERTLPCVHWITRDLQEQEIVFALKNSGTVVLPSRVARFDPIVSAALLYGTPVVATDELLAANTVIEDIKDITVSVKSKNVPCEDAPCSKRDSRVCDFADHSLCWHLSSPPTWHEIDVQELSQALHEAFEKRHQQKQALQNPQSTAVRTGFLERFVKVFDRNSLKTLKYWQLERSFSPSSFASYVARCYTNPSFAADCRR